MGLMAVMLVSMPNVLSKDLHTQIERELQTTVKAIGADQLKSVAIQLAEAKDVVPVSTGYFWYDVDLFNQFGAVLFMDGYPRGPIEQYARLAQTIEQMIPAARIWYGDNDRMDALILFDRQERERLLRISAEGSSRGQ